MKREVRLVDLLAPTLERVAIGLVRASEVGDVEIAVSIEHFSKSHGDDGAGGAAGAAYLESRPSRKVLAEIENRLTGWRLPDRDGLELAYPSHGRSFGGHKPRRRRIQQDDGSPPGIVVRRCGPAGPLETGVVCLSAVDVRRLNRTRGRLPQRVGADVLDAPVLIEDLELQAQSDPPAIDIAPALEAELAAVPAVAQDRAGRVVAGLEQLRDVVGLVLYAVMVGRPSRGEQLIAHASTVEIHFVQPETRGVESRSRHDAAHAKRATQER